MCVVDGVFDAIHFGCSRETSQPFLSRLTSGSLHQGARILLAPVFQWLVAIRTFFRRSCARQELCGGVDGDNHHRLLSDRRSGSSNRLAKRLCNGSRSLGWTQIDLASLGRANRSASKAAGWARVDGRSFL